MESCVVGALLLKPLTPLGLVGIFMSTLLVIVALPLTVYLSDDREDRQRTLRLITSIHEFRKLFDE